ncbi:MAG: cytochrome c-type biogenesis protein CcmH [Methyloprofundus sp.]|nr:MAG: cytochrome c-type biogenesis protein CcmH [Methyloprofundus sp.]
MMTLWIVFAAMLLLAAFVILWPLAAFKGSNKSHPVVSQKQENINIFQERLAELEHEQQQGNLDKPAFLQLKTELEKTLLGDVSIEEAPENKQITKANSMNWLVIGGITCIVVIGSLLTYQSLGASEQYEQYLALGEPAGQPAQQATSPVGQQAKAPDFATAVVALQAKLTEDPENIENWFLLANSYNAMGKYSEAAAVYKKMADIIGVGKPGYASVKAAYAQTLFQISGETMVPEAQQAMEEALRVDPEEPTALILQGLQAYQQQAYPEAIAAWEKAKIKGGKAQVQRFIEPAIVQARSKMGELAPPVNKPSKTSTATAGAAGITIKLDISPAFKAKLKPTERIFVFAKGKMPMPLAAERLQVKDLPITIVLDDTKAAMPTAKISSVEFVEITARVALSGSPRAVKGDLYVTAKKVAVHKGLTLTMVIDKVVE